MTAELTAIGVDNRGRWRTMYCRELPSSPTPWTVVDDNEHRGLNSVCATSLSFHSPRAKAVEPYGFRLFACPLSRQDGLSRGFSLPSNTHIGNRCSCVMLVQVPMVANIARSTWVWHEDTSFKH
jgi:hypothetical protein